MTAVAWVTAAVWVQSLARELPHAMGAEEKKKKKPIRERALSTASCLLAWLPYSKGFFSLQKTVASEFLLW